MPFTFLNENRSAPTCPFNSKSTYPTLNSDGTYTPGPWVQTPPYWSKWSHYSVTGCPLHHSIFEIEIDTQVIPNEVRLVKKIPYNPIISSTIERMNEVFKWKFGSAKDSKLISTSKFFERPVDTNATFKYSISRDYTQLIYSLKERLKRRIITSVKKAYKLTREETIRRFYQEIELVVDVLVPYICQNFPPRSRRGPKSNQIHKITSQTRLVSFIEQGYLLTRNTND